MRHLKEKILAFAHKNAEEKKQEVSTYRMQDTTEDDAKPKKDKK